MRTHYYLITALTIMSACNTNNKSTGSEAPNNQVYNFSLEKNAMVIPIDEETPNHSSYLSYFANDTAEYLVFYNEYLNQLNFYNLTTRAIAYKVPLKKEGSNGVGKSITGFYVKSIDSIYVFPKTPRFYQINSEGKVIESYNLTTPATGEPVLGSIASTMLYNPAYLEEGLLYLSMIPDGLWGSMSAQEISKKSISLVYDISKKYVKQLHYSYPPNNWDAGYREPTFSRIRVNGDSFFSFNDSHYIYVGNNGKYSKKIAAKSNYVKLSERPDITDMLGYQKFFVESARYGNIIYDQFNNLYYRFAYLGYELDVIDNDYAATNPPKCSIIIFDKNFKKVGEYRLPEKVYLVNNSFVGSEGLYISQSYRFNQKLPDEDNLYFSLLKIKKKIK